MQLSLEQWFPNITYPNRSNNVQHSLSQHPFTRGCIQNSKVMVGGVSNSFQKLRKQNQDGGLEPATAWTPGRQSRRFPAVFSEPNMRKPVRFEDQKGTENVNNWKFKILFYLKTVASAPG